MKINKEVKVDVAYASTAVCTSMTTPYFSMQDYSKAMFVWSVCQVSPLATSTGTVYQAINGSAAGSAAALASTTATISAHTKCTRFTITPGSAVDTSAITITTYQNDGTAYTALTYTGVPTLGSAGNTTASRYFATNDTASGTAIWSNICTNLAALINNASYGLKGGAYASATSTTVTIRSKDGGNTAFTFTSSSTANLVCVVDEATGMIEVEATSLTVTSSFSHLALSVTNSTSCHTSAWIIRGGTKRKVRVQNTTITTLG